jgi:hypothetical protein
MMTYKAIMAGGWPVRPLSLSGESVVGSGMFVGVAWPVEFRAVRVPMRKVRSRSGVPARDKFTALDLE